MKKFTILCDFDDVLINFCEVWVELINEQNGTLVNIKDITEWEISKFFPTLTEEQIYKPLYEGKIWDKVTPLRGAVNYLKRLKEDGHKVYIVTSSHYKTIETKTEKVMFKYFPFIDISDVIVCHNKQMIMGDFLIDDGIHNLINISCSGILMTQPHNINYDISMYDNITRVYDWKGIYDIITKASNEDI